MALACDPQQGSVSSPFSGAAIVAPELAGAKRSNVPMKSLLDCESSYSPANLACRTEHKKHYRTLQAGWF
jgi:hypothetical protein